LLKFYKNHVPRIRQLLKRLCFGLPLQH